MAWMTDEEATRHLPAVNEFVGAVYDRDEAYVWACFQHTRPETLAILCAELLTEARREGSREVNHGLWVELKKTRAQLVAARGLLSARAAASDASAATRGRSA